MKNVIRSGVPNVEIWENCLEKRGEKNDIDQ